MFKSDDSITPEDLSTERESRRANVPAPAVIRSEQEENRMQLQANILLLKEIAEEIQDFDLNSRNADKNLINLLHGYIDAYEQTLSTSSSVCYDRLPHYIALNEQNKTASTLDQTSEAVRKKLTAWAEMFPEGSKFRSIYQLYSKNTFNLQEFVAVLGVHAATKQNNTAPRMYSLFTEPAVRDSDHRQGEALGARILRFLGCPKRGSRARHR